MAIRSSDTTTRRNDLSDPLDHLHCLLTVNRGVVLGHHRRSVSEDHAGAFEAELPLQVRGRIVPELVRVPPINLGGVARLLNRSSVAVYGVSFAGLPLRFNLDVASRAVPLS